jgi:SPP1 family predicted phage head-tail adaptor
MALARRLSDGIQYKPASSLRHRITLLTKGDSDNMGNVAAPTEFKTVWANVQAIRGQELLRADQIVQKEIYQITIRYLAGVDESMLVVFKGKTFQIDYIENPDGRNVELRLMCSETDTSI